ncbi:hypothetical protein PR048_029524 [Dryococelus australis]|uniref:2-phosphoxylose phosphatase 1 n=1 Tax=Dryococelus australis TaxID=614101 RepID=A0ABQ9GDP0_9NEOP|nr:hypothetical protein PR048_029524 [Dryococelus australis]
MKHVIALKCERIRTFPLSSLSSLGRGDRAVSLFASQGVPGSLPGRASPVLSHVGIVPDDAAGRRVFSGISSFPPPFHSGADPYSPCFTLIGSRDLDLKSRPNLSTHSIVHSLARFSKLCLREAERYPESLILAVSQVGFESGYKLGTFLRSRYDQLLPRKYNMSSIRVRSTYSDRTLQTAECLLSGLYPPLPSTTGNVRWQPVPIFTVQPEQDYILKIPTCKLLDDVEDAVDDTDEMKCVEKRISKVKKYVKTVAGTSHWNHVFDAFRAEVMVPFERVRQWIERSPPTEANQVTFPAGLLPEWLSPSWSIFPRSTPRNSGGDKDDTATCIKCAIAPKRKSLNWRAVFSSHCSVAWFNAVPLCNFVCTRLLYFEIQCLENAVLSHFGVFCNGVSNLRDVLKALDRPLLKCVIRDVRRDFTRRVHKEDPPKRTMLRWEHKLFLDGIKWRQTDDRTTNLAIGHMCLGGGICAPITQVAAETSIRACNTENHNIKT